MSAFRGMLRPRRTPMAALLAAGLLVSACGGGDGSPKAPPDGTVVFHFTLGGSATTSPNLVSPKEGPVYGAIFLTSDVTLTGPRADAKSVVDVNVSSVDLRQVPVSTNTFQADLPAGHYSFLGFWDLNRSATSGDAGAPRPDNGDPVCLADTNKFVVNSGETTQYTVIFDLIYAFN